MYRYMQKDSFDGPFYLFSRTDWSYVEDLKRAVKSLPFWSTYYTYNSQHSSFSSSHSICVSLERRKNDKYSVCSAYQICIENIWDTSHLSRLGHWKSIWSIKTPLKVKNLAWSVCCGCFSTHARARLVSSGVTCPTNDMIMSSLNMWKET